MTALDQICAAVKRIGLERVMETVREDDGGGFCVACWEPAEGFCEPDAERYPCESCGAEAVYGAEQLVLMTVA